MKVRINAIWVSLLLLLFTACFPSGVNAASRRPIFTLTELPKARHAADRTSIGSVRESEIAINFLAFRGGNASRLDLPLFDGRTYSAVRIASEGTEIRSIGDFTWRGKIIDDKFSGDVVLTVHNGYLAGLIYSPEAVYEIVPKGERQILIELEQSLFPPCGGEIHSENEPDEMSQISPLGGADSGDRIDVLVLYTTPVKNTLGGDTQAQAFAQQAIDATNTAYINSRVRQRVRLAKAEETAIAETGSLGTELSTLRANAAAAASRNSFAADLVAMISNSNDNCGIGYLMGGVAGNSNNAFTVTSRTCAVGNLSFAHELGHNMGSTHNPENGSGATYPYGYGHYVNGSYRTVMSYVNQCPSGCTRVAYFSNPNVIFNSFPTGIADARDNARALNNTADTIANYRYSGSSITMTTFNGPDVLPRYTKRALRWTSDNVVGDVRIEISFDEGISWETRIANWPNTGVVPIFSNGPQTPLGRLRVVSIANSAITDSSLANISLQ